MSVVVEKLCCLVLVVVAVAELHCLAPVAVVVEKHGCFADDSQQVCEILLLDGWAVVCSNPFVAGSYH